MNRLFRSTACAACSMRAAEIRDSEQQQIFDSLDEIHARLAALDALGNMRKRLVRAARPHRGERPRGAARRDRREARRAGRRARLDDPGGGVAAGQAGQAVRPAGRAPRRHGRAHGGHLRAHGRAGRPARRPPQAPRRPRQPARPARDAPRRHAVVGGHADQGAHRRGRAEVREQLDGRAARVRRDRRGPAQPARRHQRRPAPAAGGPRGQARGGPDRAATSRSGWRRSRAGSTP